MTNQASEDELQRELERLYRCVVYDLIDDVDRKELWIKEVGVVVKRLVRTEKLKLLNELDKSMPTAEQLTTKYGYHMPDKEYGYKLALHDIREVLAKMEAEL